MEQFISVIAGFLAVPLINYVKAKFGLSGKPAALLAAAMSVIIALIALFAYGQINLASFTLENFASVFGLVFAAATLAYKLIVAE